jgi:proteasome lid subunit RPN8/RPN11
MRVAQAKAEQMYAQALAEFPFECCGMIIGPEAEDIGLEDRVRPCRNVQQELHQQYPERFPRDATIGYTMAKEDIEAIVKEAQERGWVVKVCYHSHPGKSAICRGIVGMSPHRRLSLFPWKCVNREC